MLLIYLELKPERVTRSKYTRKPCILRFVLRVKIIYYGSTERSFFVSLNEKAAFICFFSIITFTSNP